MKRIETSLKKCGRFVVETDTENPEVIAVITRDGICVADGYRICMLPEANLLEVLKDGFSKALRQSADSLH